MTDFTNLNLSDIMLDMMCSESVIFVLVSEKGDIITQTPAAEKLFDTTALRPIAEVLSEHATISLKTCIKTGEKIQTIEFIDSILYRLEIRPCKYGALLYFMPAQNLFQGLPAHTKNEFSISISKILMATHLIEKRNKFDKHLLESITKNTFRIQRELFHLQILENRHELELCSFFAQYDLCKICNELISECNKIAIERNYYVNISLDAPKTLFAVFDKKLLSHAILNLITNAIISPSVSNITIKLYSKNGYIYIDVIDNGDYISDECLSFIGSDEVIKQDMDSFRLNKINSASSGLGLSVVSKIANVHSGIFKVLKLKDGGNLMRICFSSELQADSINISQSIPVQSLDIIKTELSIL